jgi:transcriptional regulator with XRE-family HTH domain
VTADRRDYSDTVRAIVNLPTELKAHRAARGLSLRDVEAATGVNNVTILNIENGKDYRVSNLLALAEWLDRQTTIRKPQVSPGTYRLGPARYPR